MKKNAFLRPLLSASIAAALFCASPAMFAEDIDLYTTGQTNSDIPNVLFMLDNSANWAADGGYANCTYEANGTEGPDAQKEQGKKVAIEKCALYRLISSLKPKVVNGQEQPPLVRVGFMLFNEGSITGGYPRQALMPLTRAYADELLAAIKNFARDQDKTNNPSFAQTMYESFLYFKGRDEYRGKDGTKWHSAAFEGSGSRYKNPLLSDCQKNHIIIITNGSADFSSASTDAALLSSLGGDATQITYPSNANISSNDQKSLADEFARFMFRTDLSTTSARQNIVTHTVAVTGASSDGNYPNFFKGIASAGGGKYYQANSASQLTAALLELLNEIQSVNSVFASSSLPVSVNAQGTYLNQIYMGMFRPDGSAKPRWMGNLKQYQFCVDDLGKLYLGDQTCKPAVSSKTGFIAPSATSFWSTASTYWNFDNYTVLPASDAPDGDMVEKGGAAQRLRTDITPADRKLYTCPTSGCTAELLSASPFNTTTIATGSSANQTAFKVANATELADLINWVRGQDLDDENKDGSTTDMRASVHGDVLHSRPVVVNYGSTHGIVAFYGANDGVLRAVDARQTGGTAGRELWGFIAPEFYGKLRRLRSNSPEMKTPSTPSGINPPPEPKDYFFDGPIGVYQKLNDTTGATEKVHLYVGMRRGGRFIYAMDVTDPKNPEFLWKKGCFQTNGTTTCDADYSALGQTWSEPKVTRIRGRANPVLIFGGGYDNVAEDPEPPLATTMGNAVFVVDAIDGSVIKVFKTSGMTKSFPAEVTLIDRDYDGYTDRVYATDVGASVWRFDLATEEPSGWTVNEFARLSTTLHKRKIFYPVDVVLTNNFDAVLTGTGDREHPLASNAANNVLNRFYMLKDENIGKSVPATFATIVDADLDANNDLFNATTLAYNNTKRGWFVNLANGEKVVNAPVTIGGFVNFGTNQPKANSAGQCYNLGLAQGYAIDFIQGAPTTPVLFEGGGLPPSPVAGLVEIVKNGKVEKVPFVIGGGDPTGSAMAGQQVSSSAIQGQKPVIRTPKTRRRTYSYKKFD